MLGGVDLDSFPERRRVRIEPPIEFERDPNGVVELAICLDVRDVLDATIIRTFHRYFDFQRASPSVTARTGPAEFQMVRRSKAGTRYSQHSKPGCEYPVNTRRFNSCKQEWITSGPRE